VSGNEMQSSTFASLYHWLAICKMVHYISGAAIFVQANKISWDFYH